MWVVLQACPKDVTAPEPHDFCPNTLIEPTIPQRYTHTVAATPDFRTLPKSAHVEAPGPGTFDLYYSTPWGTDDVYLHYNPNNQVCDSVFARS